MVRIRYLSDLHFEFMSDRGRDYIASLNDVACDVIVFAGDLTNPGLVHATLEQISDRFKDKEIIFVLGNHDFYGAKFDDALREARSLSFMRPHLHVLECETVTIKGQRFFGATLWYPLGYGLDPIVYGRWLRWSDSRWILDARDKIPGRYADTIRAMEEQLEPGDVVVTHMLPAPQSIADEWEGALTNSFFLGDCTGLIAAKRPTLWIHGHTHCHTDYFLGRTQVVANPKGLPWIGDEGENPKFDPDRVIEV